MMDFGIAGGFGFDPDFDYEGEGGEQGWKRRKGEGAFLPPWEGSSGAGMPPRRCPVL